MISSAESSCSCALDTPARTTLNTTSASRKTRRTRLGINDEFKFFFPFQHAMKNPRLGVGTRSFGFQRKLSFIVWYKPQNKSRLQDLSI